MRYFLFVLVFVSLYSLSGQRRNYTNKHTLNKFWTKYNQDRSDSSSCTFELSWIAFYGNGTWSAFLNKEVAQIACIMDSCPSDSVTEHWAELQANQFHEDWESVLEDDFYPLHFDQSITISALENNRFISITRSEYGYTGGAHGYYFSISNVIDKSDGSRVESWQDLVSDTAALLRIAEAEFRRDKELQDSIPTNQFWFHGGDFYLSQNFYFDDSGMVFLYNIYEIASYAEGLTELHIPYSQLDAFSKSALH